MGQWQQDGKDGGGRGLRPWDSQMFKLYMFSLCSHAVLMYYACYGQEKWDPRDGDSKHWAVLSCNQMPYAQVRSNIRRQ